MAKLIKPGYACVYFGGRAALDVAFREIVETSPKLSEAVKHRALLGEMVLRGITPADPTNLQAVALQLMMAKGPQP